MESFGSVIIMSKVKNGCKIINWRGKNRMKFIKGQK